MSPFTSASIDDHFSGVDQVHDQPLQRGRVLDLRPGLLEDFAQHARLLAQFFQDVPVVGLQFVAVELQQARPAQRRRHDGLAVVRRLGQLVGHLQEEQKRDLLRVGHVRQPVHRIAVLYRQGQHAEDIAQSYPYLTLSQICTALAYFHANRAEIESELAAADAEYDELKQQST